MLVQGEGQQSRAMAASDDDDDDAVLWRCVRMPLTSGPTLPPRTAGSAAASLSTDERLARRAKHRVGRPPLGPRVGQL